MSGIFNHGIHSGHLVMPNIHAGIQTMQSDHLQYKLFLEFSLRSYTHAPQGLWHDHHRPNNQRGYATLQTAHLPSKIFFNSSYSWVYYALRKYCIPRLKLLLKWFPHDWLMLLSQKRFFHEIGAENIVLHDIPIDNLSTRLKISFPGLLLFCSLSALHTGNWSFEEANFILRDPVILIYQLYNV